PARKKLYIETVGCQMNLLDSELVVGKLRNEGYELTEDIAQADTILYNTCSVRQHAEDKIYSALGRVRALKALKPELTVGVLGC
ncbi:tRNA (N6-isopentenyl adenosine(37)-C2)-methylthiotransferase MiaB, partial [Staphylococcus aureus]|nr:tRNA (N6-isopentenyl adenosine(37)-C2)-methylthiotransferase MiaB [Staphylococcus aureus]